jgi:hypothetical protein
MEKNIICVYCGGKKVKLKVDYSKGIPETVGFCKSCKKELRDEESPTVTSYFTEGEWEQYKKSTGCSLNVEPKEDRYWLLYLLKAVKKHIVFDLSKDNIERCAKIYQEHNKDRNALFRYLMVQVLTDKDWDRLAESFFEPVLGETSRRDDYIYELAWLCRKLAFSDHGREKIKGFLQWYAAKYSRRFNNLIWNDIGSNAITDILSELIGSKIVFGFLGNPADVVSFALDPLTNHVGEFSDVLPAVCVAAESAFQDARFGEAMFLFDHILLFCQILGETNESENVLRGFYQHKDIFPQPLTLFKIKKRIQHCLEKISRDSSGEQLERYHEILRRRQNDDFKSKRETSSEIGNTKWNLEIYQKISKIFQLLFANNLEEARKCWRQFLKDSEVVYVFQDRPSMKAAFKKITGISVSKFGKTLSRKNKKEVGKSFGAEVFVTPYFVISELEVQLREFISRSLIAHYRSQRSAWGDGVPVTIRQRVAARREEQDPLRRDTDWNFLDFSDYSDIIRKKGNWDAAFKKDWFIADKLDAQLSPDKLTEFLSKLIPIRNSIMHNRHLSEEQRQVLSDAKERFEKIYKKWLGA